MRGGLTSGPMLRRFFDGLIQHAFFEKLGLADVQLADYLGELLCRFVRMDAIFGVRDVRGRRLEEVAEMLAEAGDPLAPRQRRRAVHKHIGDFVLFWTGVYPEFLSRLRAPARKDHLVDYVAQGRQSYYIASTFDREPFRREARTLRRLSEELELCAFGLSLVRRGWESLARDSYRRFHRRWQA
jgi:hypothetical protein